MCGEDYQLGDSLSDLGCIISGWSVISRCYLRAGTLKQVLAKSARLGEEDVVSKPCSAGGGASTMNCDVNCRHETLVPQVLGEDLIPIRRIPPD